MENETCLHCQAICQDETNQITGLPTAEKINKKELLKTLCD